MGKEEEAKEGHKDRKVKNLKQNSLEKWLG